MRTRKKDEDFTNIRVHIKTHEELNAIGKRGESMDDIVKKCLESYKQVQLGQQYQQIFGQDPGAKSDLSEEEGYASSSKMRYPLSKEPLDSSWHKIRGKRVMSKYDEIVGENIGQVKGISFNFVEVEDPSGMKRYIIPKNLFVGFDEYSVYIPFSSEELKNKYSDTNKKLKSEYIKESQLPPIPPPSSEPGAGAGSKSENPIGYGYPTANSKPSKSKKR